MTIPNFAAQQQQTPNNLLRNRTVVGGGHLSQPKRNQQQQRRRRQRQSFEHCSSSSLIVTILVSIILQTTAAAAAWANTNQQHPSLQAALFHHKAAASSTLVPATTVRTTTTTTTARMAKKEDFDAGNKLKEEAERLRQEVMQLEREKAERIKVTQQRMQVVKAKAEEETNAKMAERAKYLVDVPILKPDGSTQIETIFFPPFYQLGESSSSSSKLSFVTVVEASLPLGIILGESDYFAGAVSVDEVMEGSNGQVQAGLQVGDLVRAFTACKMQMEQPAWQLLAGGIGRPKTMRFMYAADFRPFEEVMDAMSSNRMDPVPNRPVLLVIERKRSSEQ